MLRILALLLIILLLCVLFRTSKGGHDSRYSKTHNFMDFDPGVDSDKVGSKDFPNAGPDSVMKHEFMKKLFDDK